jgi:hypothetical protein
MLSREADALYGRGEPCKERLTTAQRQRRLLLALPHLCTLDARAFLSNAPTE